RVEAGDRDVGVAVAVEVADRRVAPQVGKTGRHQVEVVGRVVEAAIAARQVDAELGGVVGDTVPVAAGGGERQVGAELGDGEGLEPRDPHRGVQGRPVVV